MNWEKKYKTLENQILGLGKALNTEQGRKQMALTDTYSNVMAAISQILLYAYAIEETDLEDKTEINKYCIANKDKMRRNYIFELLIGEEEL